jgi:VWFA-related protein
MVAPTGYDLHRVFKILLLLILSVACFADNLVYVRIEQPVIEKRLQTVPATDTDRISTIRAQFKAAGCTPDQIQEQAIPDEDLPNIICTLPGPEPGAIIIATRLDSKAHGEEGQVDWGGPVMLPLLAESLNAAPHRQTLVFAAFAGHDREFAGANWYLEQLTSDQRAQIRGMIQIDHVGRTPAAYAFPGPDTSRLASVGQKPVLRETAHDPTTLSKVLPIAARSLKLPQAPKLINDIPATDARAFEDANIPSIVIHSVAYAEITPPGKFEQVHLMRTALDPKVYNDTYNLMCVYVLYLDKVYSLAWSKALELQKAQAGPAPQEEGATPGNSQSEAKAPTVAMSSTPAANAAPPSTPAAESHLQQAPPQAEGAPTNPVFRTTTRLVQVDVVVTDKQGRPVPGLKQSDFSVLQDGKPQQVRVFEPHTGAATSPGSSAASNTPKLPPNTYSNHPYAATADSWTIVLFDLLNTPTADQEYSRKQLIEMLRAAPKGQPIALYLLTSRLTMVQGFTDEPDKLLQAAENLRPNRSHVLTTEAERQHAEGQIAYANAELTESAPASSQNSPIMTQMNQVKQQQVRDLAAFQIADRAIFTLAAFESLSRAVSGYPGRKNLIWLSTSFPIQIEADPKMDSQPWRNATSFRNQLAAAGSLLAKSRIAVYPVDVRGLQGRGVDISTSATESGLYTSSPNSANYGDLIATQTSAYSDERFTMKQVAEQTGGEAFLGTNDLKRAMQRSMEDGSTYYTLAYTPDKVDPQTAFHRIEVKVSQPGVKLAYRRGYYSSPPKAGSPATEGAALRGALQPGMPQSTMLFLTASVLPPDASHKDVRIQYIVNPNGVTFTDMPDQRKHITLDCIAIAYDNDGKEIAHASNTLDGTIKAAAYETVMNNGIPAQQELTLPPGAYNLRLGVMDRPSQQIGTVDVPLVVAAGEATAKK